MKRRLTLSIALALSIVQLSLASTDSTARSAPPLKFNADSGIIALGPNQALRVSVANGLDPVTVRFIQLEYMQAACDGGVCKYTVSSQVTSNLISLAPGDAAATTLPTLAAGESVRCVVSSNSKKLRVNVMIIDTTTGKVDAFFDVFFDGSE